MNRLHPIAGGRRLKAPKIELSEQERKFAIAASEKTFAWAREVEPFTAL